MSSFPGLNNCEQYWSPGRRRFAGSPDRGLRLGIAAEEIRRFEEKESGGGAVLERRSVNIFNPLVIFRRLLGKLTIRQLSSQLRDN